MLVIRHPPRTQSHFFASYQITLSVSIPFIVSIAGFITSPAHVVRRVGVGSEFGVFSDSIGVGVD